MIRVLCLNLRKPSYTEDKVPFTCGQADRRWETADKGHLVHKMEITVQINSKTAKLYKHDAMLLWRSLLFTLNWSKCIKQIVMGYYRYFILTVFHITSCVTASVSQYDFKVVVVYFWVLLHQSDESIFSDGKHDSMFFPPSVWKCHHTWMK